MAEHVQDAVGGCSANHKLLVSVPLVGGKPWRHTQQMGERECEDKTQSLALNWIQTPVLGKRGCSAWLLVGGPWAGDEKRFDSQSRS